MAQTLLAGIGSSHGDDRVAWNVLEQIAPISPHVEILPLADPSRLLDHLQGAEQLILIDAMQTGRAAGSVLRLTWPDALLVAASLGRSSHGMGLGAVLALADRLGKLPARVVVFGIEGGNWNQGHDLSPTVAAAVPGLRDRVLQEIEGAT